MNPRLVWVLLRQRCWHNDGLTDTDRVEVDTGIGSDDLGRSGLVALSDVFERVAGVDLIRPGVTRLRRKRWRG